VLVKFKLALLSLAGDPPDQFVEVFQY